MSIKVHDVSKGKNKKNKKDYIPIAAIVPHQELKNISKWKPGKRKREIEIEDSDYIPEEKKIRRLELPPPPDDDPSNIGDVFEYIPYMKENQRNATFIWGAAGSGKSVAARKTIEKIRKMKGNSNLEVLIFSANSTAKEDPSFQKLKNSSFIDMTKIFYLLQLEAKHFKDQIVIFDDWESVSTSLTRVLQDLIRELLEHSRKSNVHVICITHQPRQGERTKSIIQESDTFILFHQNDWMTCKQFLIDKLGMRNNNELLEEIRKLPGHDITIHRSKPTGLVSDKKIILF